MAKAISDEELQLKKRARRRLVGAIALVLLIIVFLPMVLDSEPRPRNEDVAISIPPISNPESIPNSSLPAAPASLPQPQVAGMPAPAAPGAVPELEAAPEPEQRSVPASQESRSGQETRTAPESFVVQLGAFSNAANARALQKKLQDNQFKAYTETIKSSNGDRTRVRVGPYPSRESAEKARERLKVRKLIIGDAAVVRQD